MEDPLAQRVLFGQAVHQSVDTKDEKTANLPLRVIMLDYGVPRPRPRPRSLVRSLRVIISSEMDGDGHLSCINPAPATRRFYAYAYAPFVQTSRLSVFQTLLFFRHCHPHLTRFLADL